MFDSTFHILAEEPVAIAPFLFALWATYRTLQPHRDRIVEGIACATVGLVVPLFAALFLAEFIAHPATQWLAEMVITVEAAAFRWGFRLLDALMAAWLHVFLLFLAGVFFVLEETAASAAPVLTDNEFLITVFIFEFVAGAALLYILYLTTQAEKPWWDTWLTGSGVILFVSGWLALLVRSGAAQVSEATLLSGFIVATLGLASGMMAMILLVRPDFDGDSIVVHLRETETWQIVWGAESDADEQEREVTTDTRH